MALKILSTNSPGSRLSHHDRAMSLAADFRNCEIELFKVLTVISEERVYLDLQIPSLFEYCTEMLKLSRHSAYDLITVVRKGSEIPAIGKALTSGKTTVSKLRKVCSVITEENADEWIGLTMECSTRVVEKAVALANPRSAVPEQMKYMSADTLQFQLAVSEEWSELLTCTKDQLSQKHQRAVSSEEALFIAMNLLNEKLDPVRKAARSAKRSARLHNATAAETQCFKDPEPTPENRVRTEAQIAGATASRYIPARVRHEIALRDRNQCSFTDRQGKRCTQKRWLQKHHVVHFSEGGTHSVENLRTLCWAHHCMEHR